MDINYELYKVFYYVATTLSFSEASKSSTYLNRQSASLLKRWKENCLRLSSSAALRRYA